MHFAIINPARQETTVIDCNSIDEACRIAGLKLGSVDIGVVAEGIAVIVYEYSLFVQPSEQSYFAIDGRLFAGVAVIYGFKKNGETASLQGVPPITFMPNAKAVERSIALGLVDRPQIRANDTVIWQWPQPNPLGVTA